VVPIGGLSIEAIARVAVVLNAAVDHVAPASFQVYIKPSDIRLLAIRADR